MTLVETRTFSPSNKQKPKPSRVISPGVVSTFSEAVGLSVADRITAESRLRKILRQSRPTTLKDEPKNVQIPKGVQVEYRSHWMRPDVVYRLYSQGGVEHCDMVIRIDKEGRLGYKKR